MQDASQGALRVVALCIALRSSSETRRNICKALTEVSLSNLAQSGWCSDLFFGQSKLGRQ